MIATEVELDEVTIPLACTIRQECYLRARVDITDLDALSYRMRALVLTGPLANIALRCPDLIYRTVHAGLGNTQHYV